uniref:Putative secreted protein n=1 Tax=Ixodes ricinus TaxID=34613 RepID=A0A6B0UBW0_IXORI
MLLLLAGVGSLSLVNWPGLQLCTTSSAPSVVKNAGIASRRSLPRYRNAEGLKCLEHTARSRSCSGVLFCRLGFRQN